MAEGVDEDAVREFNQAINEAQYHLRASRTEFRKVEEAVLRAFEISHRVRRPAEDPWYRRWWYWIVLNLARVT